MPNVEACVIHTMVTVCRRDAAGQNDDSAGSTVLPAAAMRVALVQSSWRRHMRKGVAADTLGGHALIFGVGVCIGVGVGFCKVCEIGFES